MNKKILAMVCGAFFIIVSIISIDMTAQTDFNGESITDLSLKISDKKVQEVVRKFERDKINVNLNLDQLEAIK